MRVRTILGLVFVYPVPKAESGTEMVLNKCLLTDRLIYVSSMSILTFFHTYSMLQKSVSSLVLLFLVLMPISTPLQFGQCFLKGMVAKSIILLQPISGKASPHTD